MINPAGAGFAIDVADGSGPPAASPSNKGEASKNHGPDFGLRNRCRGGVQEIVHDDKVMRLIEIEQAPQEQRAATGGR